MSMLARRAAPAPMPPLVTVLVPARNEEHHVARSIERIAAQDYDPDRLEVLVVDGASSDRTVAEAEAAFERFGLRNARVVVNPTATTPSNLNHGLAEASGEILCRVDAHCLVPIDYVSRCVDVLTTRPETAVTGGAQVTVPPSPTALGLGIARALNNRWGMGFSRYRRGAASGPTDTVYLGAFRTAELRAAGGWDERLPTNQDFDLNRRMGRNGVVWFDAELEVDYVPRSDLGALFRQYRRFGQWKVRYWRMTGDRPRSRQLVILAAPLGAAAAAALALSRPRWRARALVGMAVTAAAVETLGSSRPRSRSAAVHVASLGALGAVSAGWLSGVYTELLRGGSGR